ncbi:phosphopantetheine-binding protein [Pseudomonas sp. App30]|uniref:phosphopantetheine-binding protein n=1 Tax=Pseudomonas sp. App30 TaxID=3068990 RepID=UPI003A80A716
MNRTDIQLYIHSTIEQQLAAQQCDPPRLDLAELFRRLEKLFGVPLDPDRVLRQVSTINDLSRLIQRMNPHDRASA